MVKVKIFIDSDVIISSLLSQTGASNIIVNDTDLSAFISNFSYEELDRIVDKLGVDKNKLERLLKNKLKTVKIKLNKEKILDKFGNYTNDIKDAHIVAGTKTAKAKFLVTFNIKDYRIGKIQQELGIRVITPGGLMQYLRSLV